MRRAQKRLLYSNSTKATAQGPPARWVLALSKTREHCRCRPHGPPAAFRATSRAISGTTPPLSSADVYHVTLGNLRSCRRHAAGRASPPAHKRTAGACSRARTGDVIAAQAASGRSAEACSPAPPSASDSAGGSPKAAVSAARAQRRAARAEYVTRVGAAARLGTQRVGLARIGGTPVAEKTPRGRMGIGPPGSGAARNGVGDADAARRGDGRSRGKTDHRWEHLMHRGSILLCGWPSTARALGAGRWSSVCAPPKAGGNRAFDA